MITQGSVLSLRTIVLSVAIIILRDSIVTLGMDILKSDRETQSPPNSGTHLVDD
jgi:hypothetical protein